MTQTHTPSDIEKALVTAEDLLVQELDLGGAGCGPDRSTPERDSDCAGGPGYVVQRCDQDSLLRDA